MRRMPRSQRTRSAGAAIGAAVLLSLGAAAPAFAASAPAGADWPAAVPFPQLTGFVNGGWFSAALPQPPSCAVSSDPAQGTLCTATIQVVAGQAAFVALYQVDVFQAGFQPSTASPGQPTGWSNGEWTVQIKPGTSGYLLSAARVPVPDRGPMVRNSAAYAPPTDGDGQPDALPAAPEPGGDVIVLDGEPWRVLSWEDANPTAGGMLVRAELEHTITGERDSRVIDLTAIRPMP